MTDLLIKNKPPALILRIFLILVAVACFSCSTKTIDKKGYQTTCRYAKGFSMVDLGSVKKVEIVNPWENARNIRFEYYFVHSGIVLPDSLKSRKVIRTPVKKVICMSTSHIAFLEAIGETSSIAGISGGNYVTNEKVRTAMDEGRIIDIGYGQNLNYELIINTNPDLVMVYGIGSEVSGVVKKLEDLGIGVFIVAEYLEQLPLGKTEWIRIIGALFNKEKMANDFFSTVETDYLSLKAMINKKEEGPDVLVGIPYRDTWWVPGGNSYIANLIYDAGGIYPGEKNKSHESYVISFEDAMVWAQSADIWINTGSLNSKRELLDADPRFANFRVFKEGIIFNNNQLVTAYGGNDFWESGTVYPNKVLSDMIGIFHPGLLPGRELTYYKEIK